MIEYLKRKSFVATMSFTEDDACAPDFIDTYADVCATAGPLSEFLTSAVGLEW